MKAIKYLISFQKKQLFKVVFFVFCSVFIEAVSTQFFPMLILETDLKPTPISIILIAMSLILCGADVALSPYLMKMTELQNAHICNAFRKRVIYNFLVKRHNERALEKYKAALLVSVDHLNELLNENNPQIAYRIIYGVGSFIAVLLINPKIFIAIIFTGVVVSISRMIVQPKLNELFITRSQQKTIALGFFNALLDNQLIYYNPDIAVRSFTFYKQMEYTNKNKSLAAVYARGKLQTIVSFSGDLVLFLVIFIFSEGKAGNISLLFAVRPMINFFNYINITIISTRENLDIISDFLTYNEKEEYDQRNLLSSSTAHGDSSDGGCRGVEICNLSFSYNQKNIFDDFSFKFSYGNIYEIRGPRGIGKSTLLKIIYNLLSPSNGEVLIDGEANYRIHKLENQIFYLPSSTTPFILDMESNILLGKSPPAEFLDIINTLGLGVIIKDSCENLSTGEQLRVAMARGLISKKNIFLLDEFNANLDNKTSDQIVQMLLKKAKNGALIILVNHKSSIPGAIILELGL